MPALASVLRASVLRASDLRPSPELLHTPLTQAPRGTLTEIAGPASSGRSALLCSLLAEMGAQDEFCALIDVEDTFDPLTAQAAGVRLSQLLWIRCGGNLEHALKIADLIVQGGGFGLVALDLADTPVQVARRIPLAAWFRLRRAVENTPTALISVAQQINAPSCSAFKIELARDRARWRGHLPARLLEALESGAKRTHKHHSQPQTVTFQR